MEDRDLSHLCPFLQRIAPMWLNRCMAQLKQNEKVVISTTYRNAATQNACKKLGLSNAAYGSSPHNCQDAQGNPYSKAWDYSIIRDGDYVADGKDPAYGLCGGIGEEMGLVFSKSFNSISEYDHLELPNWRTNSGS